MFEGDTAMVSGAFARSWSKPGKGKRATVWDNGGHMFIQVHNADGSFAWRFDTLSYGVPGEGPRYSTKPRPTAGFTPRHWPST
jgi:hypothetical protein